MGKIRGTHSSPGIYTKFTDLQYAANHIGITTLGLVGETLKGPAFEPIMVSSYTEYQTYFGGTSAEKYKDSQYPRYELPYIAKSYLSASDQLYVCRVLGLSGYNAGPAWAITASLDGTGNKYVIALLRSRGEYKKYANIGTTCEPITKYDTLQFKCKNIHLEAYKNLSMFINKCGEIKDSGITSASTISVSLINNGMFTIVTNSDISEETSEKYSVSLNAGAKDYIYNVLGSNPKDGSAQVYVEEFYDYYLQQLISEGKVTQIDTELIEIKEVGIKPVCEPVKDFVTIPCDMLSKRNNGESYLCVTDGIIDVNSESYNGFACVDEEEPFIVSGTTCTPNYSAMTAGYVYEVKSFINPCNAFKMYFYVVKKDKEGNEVNINGTTGTTINEIIEKDAVKVLSVDTFIAKNENTYDEIKESFSDYHESYRCATTPWIVSEIKGNGNVAEIKKLFRFHTITDGVSANEEVKISITNIRPDNGTFDVQIRDYYDIDASPVILESYKNLTMVPGSERYIGYQIGTLDGSFELKSKYVIVEVIENDMTETCVPAGFLGYPTRQYAQENVIAPSFKYNVTYDENVKDKKQYFGLSDLTGVDVDMLFYKGKNAYSEEYNNVSAYTHAFHLDSTLNPEIMALYSGFTISVDGLTGVTFDTVSEFNVTSEGKRPVIGSEEDMEGTIYENVNLRKFTVYPCGGFDGWDIYRGSRTATDEFKADKYKGTIVNGYGQTFSRISDPVNLGLKGNCITSDYYAFLAGAKQFQIPEKYVINLFATPGIDYVNNKFLSMEILDMIEEERKDSLYIMTTPDKAWGTSDAIEDIYSSSEAADNLEDTGIDTYLGATYYPWIKFEDKDNNTFINLSPNKDVLRNLANVDNKKFPWYAPAGLERGKVECKKMHFFATLEDEDNVYDGRINPLKTFSKDGVKIWGNKTMYTQDTPMNRINVVRLMLYMRKLISQSSLSLIFDNNDHSLKDDFENILNPILRQIKSDRGITDYKLQTSQTPEQMDAHEISAKIWVKPTPALEYIEIEFMITPQGVEFSDFQ